MEKHINIHRVELGRDLFFSYFVERKKKNYLKTEWEKKYGLIEDTDTKYIKLPENEDEEHE